MRRGSSEIEYRITQVTQEYQLKITTYESRVKQISQENDELRRNVQDLSNVSRKVSDYENKIVIMNQ